MRFCRSADGVRIAYAVHGSGPLLVANTCWLTHLHWACDVYRHFFDGLGELATVVRYDDRGYGLSDRDVEDFSLAARVADLRAVIDDVGADRFALLGQSAGAPVMISYASDHPEQVTRLILNAAHATPARESAAQDEFDTLLRLARVAWSDGGARFRRVYSAGLLPGGSEGELRVLDDIFLQNCSAEVSVLAALDRRKTDVTELLPRIAVPTLVLHSRGDRMISFDEGRLLAATIPAATFVALDSENHILLDREPAWPGFLSELGAFLASDRARGWERQEPAAALTEREIEVLTLAAQGLGNDEIADRLTVSARTVERHLSNAYRKLGVSGRSARAAAVARLASTQPTT